MKVEPYLWSFNGRCEEAIEFYKRALGAKVSMLARFKDNPDPMPGGKATAGIENKIMHANLTIGESTILISDGDSNHPAKFSGISLTLSVDNEAEADRLFAALNDGGVVRMPLTKTFFSPRFGMVDDRFGVSWMIIVQK